MNKIYEFNYNFNREFLLEEALDNEGWTNFIDPSNGHVFEKWFIKKINNGYAKQISDEFALKLNTPNKPRFLYQKAGFTIPFHQDRGTLCSINFILNDTQDKISFKDEDVFYKTALLNTQIEHAVINPMNDRIMLKLSIFDKTYNEVLKCITA